MQRFPDNILPAKVSRHPPNTLRPPRSHPCPPPPPSATAHFRRRSYPGDIVWLRMQPYGFALAMHCKDVDNALRLLTADGVEAPMLSHTRELMQEAVDGTTCPVPMLVIVP